MEIKSIKATRQPEKILLIFTNGLALPLPVEEVYRQSLSKNLNVGSRLFLDLVNISLIFYGYNYCLRQIAASPKNQAILEQKLKQILPRQITKLKLNQYQPDHTQIIEQVIQKLDDRNLINQSGFAFSYIRRYPKKSSKQISYELSRLKVPVELIAQALSQPNVKSDLQKINLHLQKKMSSLNNPDQKIKIIASLVRRGYSYQDIKAAIDDLTKKQ